MTKPAAFSGTYMMAPNRQGQGKSDSSLMSAKSEYL